MTIELDLLCADSGHDNHIHIVDDEEGRKKIHEKILEMLKMGATIFLEESDDRVTKIKGYDPIKNEWIVGNRIKRKGPDERVSASNTKATAVAPIAGG